jgi:hypothetical protein
MEEDLIDSRFSILTSLSFSLLLVLFFVSPYLAERERNKMMAQSGAFVKDDSVMG